MNKKNLILIIVSSVLFLDQLTKLLILKNFTLGESVPIISNIFHFTYITNTGSAFGLFKGINLVFIGITGLVVGIIIQQLRAIHEKEKKMAFALSMLLGGALGNLIDRIVHGHVVDFLDFRIWPVFNIADSAITISVIMLIFLLWKK